jgi:hypothetical protein
MAKLKIEVHEGGKPSATITIPLWLARTASKVLPSSLGKDMRKKIDIDAILQAAEDPEAHGVILQVEDHEDGDKVTISIIGNGTA